MTQKVIQILKKIQNLDTLFQKMEVKNLNNTSIEKMGLVKEVEGKYQ